MRIVAIAAAAALLGTSALAQDTTVIRRDGPLGTSTTVIKRDGDDMTRRTIDSTGSLAAPAPPGCETKSKTETKRDGESKTETETKC